MFFCFFFLLICRVSEQCLIEMSSKQLLRPWIKFTLCVYRRQRKARSCSQKWVSCSNVSGRSPTISRFLRVSYTLKTNYPHAVFSCFCRFPVVAMGLLKWVDCTVCDPSFFKLLTDSTPVHLALLDEV